MHDVIVANGVWHGGGMMLAPDARPDDGSSTSPDRRRLEGRLPDDRAEDLQGPPRDAPEGRCCAARVTVDARAPTDRGRRRVGRHDAGTFELVPGALRLRVPAS
jgi:hypothetical protein